MAPRIFDPTLFRGQGALMTFGALAGPYAVAPRTTGFFNSAKFISVFLRWQVNPLIGLPSEPFKVWRRPATPLGEEVKQDSALTIPVPPLGNVVVFEEPVVSFSAEIKAGPSAQTIIVMPMADGIGFENLLGVLSFNLPANGTHIFTFQAPYITAVLLIGTNKFEALTALPMSKAEGISNWTLVETVGFPVDEANWSDLADQDHGIKQGLVGAEVDAISAASQRFTRGINPFGWYPTFPSGEPAPKWDLAPAIRMVDDAAKELLPMLHEALRRPPEQQGFFTRDFVIHPPESPDGTQLDADDGKAVVSPLTMLQMAVSTDPLQSVALGFGTGYPYEDVSAINLHAISLSGDANVSDWDYMVTGLWRKGLDGHSEEREYAALIPRPRIVVPPPVPADVRLDFLAHRQPSGPDQPWTAATRLSWERFVLDNLTSVASFAFSRKDLANANPATALMERRPSGIGHIPIGDARNPNDPEVVRQSASDSAYPIPNTPGSVSAKYGVATQNIFGVWSPWVTHDFNSTQPDLDIVHLADANLVPTDPGGTTTVCPAELSVDFVLDWRVRRPKSVAFRGRLFAAATRSTAPPPGMPAALQKSLGAAAVPTVVTFTGDAPDNPNVICLDVQGSKQVAPGAATQGDSRRYRMKVSGFSLDYAATSHIALALQAQMTERIAPNRTGSLAPNAKVTYASDPRALPALPLPIVPLTSLPDATGECHGRITWGSQPAAQGYILYTSNEIAILTSLGQPHPAPGLSLSQRLTTLKTAFNGNSARNAFTRVNDKLIKTTSLDVVLPRGSQSIHVWIVVPLSHGGIEGPWPSGSAAADQMIVYAEPKIAEPAPPRIEVIRQPDGVGFKARIRFETRGTAGARPKRVDLYRTRVADAARQLDSMGLPIAQITATGGGFTIEEATAGTESWIATVTGSDKPAGSWKQVWYRAVAWAEDDPARGVLKGRSKASPAVPVVIPPDNAPDLGALSASWSGGGLGDVMVSFTSAAPVPKTPIGPHKIQVQASEQGVETPLLELSQHLSEVGSAAPGAGSGLWRLPDGTDLNYRILLRRGEVGHGAGITVRITDPIGRTSEQNLRIDPGSVLLPPVVSPVDAFTIAGRGKIFLVQVDNTTDDLIAGVPFIVRIEITPQPIVGPRPVVVSPPVIAPGRPLLGGRPTQPFRPIPGFGRPRIPPQFREIDAVLVFESPIAQVPTAESTKTSSVIRQRVGNRVTLTVLAREKIRAIRFTVMGPDGQSASSRARG